MRELLKPVRDILAKAHNHLMEIMEKLPMDSFQVVDPGIIQDAGYWIDRIDATLAEPQDAMELVRKIREKKYYNTDIMLPPRMGYALIAPEAAALIEARDRTVPREMLDEIVKKCWPMGNGPLYDKTMDAIAAKYRVKVEG